MLKLDLNTHIRLRGGNDNAKYLRENGFSNWMSHSITRSDLQTIALADLEQLCNLFRCTPNDLLQWIPTNEKELNNPEHHLAPLKREKEKGKTTVDILGGLTFAQMKEIAKIVLEMKGGKK